MRALILLAAVLLTTACGKAPEPAAEVAPEQATESTAAVPAENAAQVAASARLREILNGMTEDTRDRYTYRHPQETLEFFGIMPGMTVVEALPGGGWYSKILMPYLGNEGVLIGVDYSVDMMRLFGTITEERLEAKKNWVADWTAQASGWGGNDSASAEAFVFGSMPESFNGRADAVLMIRALHNLNRFEGEGGYRTTALNDALNVLKPGGILGVVQHQADESMSDTWADGSNGYLKQSALIGIIEAAGFEFVDESAINSNPADQPTTEDFVWRLPPTLATSRNDEALREALTAVGESNRMTLKFRKPD